MMRFQFVEENQKTFDVKSMCRVLKVSRSGYYAWRKRKPSAREMANQELSQEIKAVFEESGQTYGSPRICAELQAKGYPCSRYRVARLMRQNGWQAKPKRRKWVKTTDSGHDLPIASNLLNREFKADNPNEKWVTDISYIPTGEGWLYIATVMDLFSRRIVGWSMQVDMTTALVLNALNMATQTRRPKAGLLHHSDRGSQYCSHLY
jgi:transposase InsO family protein